jgi:aminoglycoside phosphotransferase (APT) family kinase protein
VPTPEIIHADFTRRRIDRDWLVASCARGSNWHYSIGRMTDRENHALNAQLGRVAAKLHATANPDGWFGYPRPFKPHTSWSSFLGAYAESLERDARTFQCAPLPPELSPTRLIARMDGILDEVRTPRLVHGDLWPRNVLFERTGQGPRITAVLDGDRALWGDPRFEWVLYGYPFPPAFWRAYGPREPSTRTGRLRNLLYKGCGGFQAAIEEWGHFRHRNKAREMMGYAIRDLTALSRHV